MIVPVPSPGHLILIRQFRPVIERWIWELPAGSLDPGEAPDTAVVRECEEEIGFTPKRVTPLGSWYPTPGFCDEIMHFYLCEDLVTNFRVHVTEVESDDPPLDDLARLLDAIGPRLVIPMHYKTPRINLAIQPVERFLEVLPNDPVDRPGATSIVVGRDALPDRRQIVVLDHAR